MNFSAHFTQDEFEHPAIIPVECFSIFTYLCEEVLEPVRAFAGPIDITSGYRDAQSNAAAHGQPNSEHMASERWCAADFVPGSHYKTAREIFDWMRTNAFIPYHQLIYETDAQGGAVIHVSVNLDKLPARSVLQGATHNAEPYVSCDYVAYIAPGEQPAGAEES
jgi:hypothetical protein